MSTLKVNAVTDASGGNTATINSMTPTADSLQGFRNRIINGGMVIDQRNAGAAVTTDAAWPVDRFQVYNSTDGAFSAQRNTTTPTGFINSLKWTTTTADSSLSASQYSGIYQAVEGFNVADLGWGTASAKTVILSFWVRSSLTGTFGGSFRNNANNRSYPFTYSISVADTWEQKTVTVAGDTSGTWTTDNTAGIKIFFGLGVGSTLSGTANSWAGANYLSATSATSVIGTLNATWYITGVQLEVGSVATPFERRDYGRELILCQRYYYKFKSRGVGYFGCGTNNGTTNNVAIIPFPVSMRTHPTALEQSGTAGDYQVQQGGTNITCSAVAVYNYADTDSATVQSTVASGLTIGYAAFLRAVNSTAYLAWSAEL